MKRGVMLTVFAVAALTVMAWAVSVQAAALPDDLPPSGGEWQETYETFCQGRPVTVTVIHGDPGVLAYVPWAEDGTALCRLDLDPYPPPVLGEAVAIAEGEPPILGAPAPLPSWMQWWDLFEIPWDTSTVEYMDPGIDWGEYGLPRSDSLCNPSSGGGWYGVWGNLSRSSHQRMRSIVVHPASTLTEQVTGWRQLTGHINFWGAAGPACWRVRDASNALLFEWCWTCPGASCGMRLAADESDLGFTYQEQPYVKLEAYLPPRVPSEPNLQRCSPHVDDWGVAWYTQSVSPPELDGEPLCTAATENTISWNNLGYPYEYRVQRAEDSGFTTGLETSAWQDYTSTDYTFTALNHDQTYWYRLRYRVPPPDLQTSEWVDVESSTQDGAPPSTTHTVDGTLMGNESWWRSPVDVTLDAVDDGCGGILATWYDLDSVGYTPYTTPFPVTTNGIHPLNYYSEDGVGNPETPKADNISIDQTPPLSTVSLNGTLGHDGWYVSPLTYDQSLIDATSGPDEMYYDDGSAWQEYTGPLTFFDCSHTVSYYGEDVAGNPETPQTISFGVDGVAPTSGVMLEGVLGNEGWYVSPVVYTQSLEDACSGPDERYYDDGSGITPYTTPVAFGDGYHYVDYYGEDAAGNVETANSISFKVDATPPTSTVAVTGTLGCHNWYTTTVTYTQSLTDSLSGPDETYVDTGGGRDLYTSPLVFGDGIYDVEYLGEDVAGNREAAATILLQVDTVPPSFLVDAPLSFCVECAQKLGIHRQASDATSGVDNWTLEIRDQADNVVRSWSGVRAVDDTLVWDGRDAEGDPVPLGIYRIVMMGQDMACWWGEGEDAVQVVSEPPPTPKPRPAPPEPITPPPPEGPSPETPTPTPTVTPSPTPMPTATPTPGTLVGPPAWDFGDAPDPGYPSLLGSDGARHTDSSFEWLGQGVDQEPEARIADLDLYDDGVSFPELGACQEAVLEVVVSVADRGDPAHPYDEGRLLYLNVLADWDQDGGWDGPSEGEVPCCEDALLSEWLVRNLAMDPSEWPDNTTSTVLHVPIVVGPEGHTWMRFTLTYNEALPGDHWDGRGGFAYGETEDYLITILPAPAPIPRAIPAPAVEETWILEGVVFQDLDRDGRHGGGEPGMSGVTVFIRNEDTSWVNSTITDGDGRYSFAVRRGRYVISVVNLPAGYSLTTPGEVSLEVPRMLAADTGLIMDFGARWRFLPWLLGTMLSVQGGIVCGLTWSGSRVRPAIMERNRLQLAIARKRRELEVAAWAQENRKNGDNGGDR